MIERRPVRVRRPECFASFKEKDECDSCEYRKKCLLLCRFFENTDTIAELTKSKKQNLPNSKGEMLQFLIDGLTKAGMKTAKTIRHSDRFKKTIASIIMVCEREKIDPRIYITSQIETIGMWAIQNKKPLYANMINGVNAMRRFEEWMNRNAKKFADHHHLRDSSVDLVTPERLFLQTYIGCEERASVVEKHVQNSGFSYWSLKLTRSKPEVRIKALRDYLASLSVIYPCRLFIDKLTRWGKIRSMIHSILRRT